ncbi:hypothetical protein CGRA01v4_05594 [Colletotrichum graminicola]|nr:hypothetical protein CGRA01v4_05594 [Colletotrichum graminicola]
MPDSSGGPSSPPFSLHCSPTVFVYFAPRLRLELFDGEMERLNRFLLIPYHPAPVLLTNGCSLR